MRNAYTISDLVLQAEAFSQNPHVKNKRGLNLYHPSQTFGVTGRTKSGNYFTGNREWPHFHLTINERIQVMKKCSDVFGVVTGRMNRIAGLEYKIVTDKDNEDRIAVMLETYKSIFDEYTGIQDIKFFTVRQQMFNKISEHLIDILPDLGNFNQSMIRWKKRIQTINVSSSNEVRDWIAEPNIHDSWSTFVKKYVFDLLVHGAVAVYKEENENKKIENFYILPGGTVYPLRNKYLGGVNAYVQEVDTEQPQIFFNDEIAFDSYAPTSSFGYGMVPLDSLVSKIAEKLLFDQLMAEQADGTKPPEKMVVFGDSSNGFGDLNADINIPMDSKEQERIETKINESKKNAIATLSGQGRPLVLDLTRENTMGIQLERQKEIKKDVALVFNMTNMEINESGSDDTSGRSTSESQERIEKSKGIAPIVQSIQHTLSKRIIPNRFGWGFKLEFQTEIDEIAEIRKFKEKLESGLFSVNEIRTKDLNLNPYNGDEYNNPPGQQQPPEQF